MKVLIRPTSTISNNISGGGISGGDGTAHGVVSDNTVKSRLRSVDSAAGTLVRFGMGTYTKTPTQRFAGVRARMMWGQTIPLGAYIEINDIDGVGVGSWRPRAFPAANAPVSMSPGDWYFLNPADGQEWEQADIDALEVYLRWLDPAGSHDARVYEVALELWVLDQPVVSNVSPTPFQHVETDTPKFVWSWLQDDNSRSPNQLGYQLKIWTQAEAEDVAFDPDSNVTSPPVVQVNRWGISTRFDLATTAGAQATDIRTPLVYGDTYYWAVKAFNHFPPTGAAWHTEWSDLTQFTVNEPPVTVVTDPTGTLTTTNKPLVEWTYADPEGISVQNRYEVRIWEEPGAGWGGFDPDTTVLEPVYQSEVISQDVAHQVTAILNNNTDFRVYVRTAHAVKDHPPYIWGDWDFNDFDIDLTPPPAPDLMQSFDTDHSVHLILVPDPPAAGEPSVERLEVQRSLDGGATWAPFRMGTLTLSDTFTWDAGAARALMDPEVPYGVEMQYRAFQVDSTAGVDVYSEPSNIITTTLKPQAVWIKNPADATMSASFMSEASWLDSSRLVAATAYGPLGRRKPLVVRGLTAGRTLPLHLLVEGMDVYERLSALLDVTHALFVVTPKWSGYASVSGDVAESARLWDDRAGEPGVWRLTIPLTEVAGV